MLHTHHLCVASECARCCYYCESGLLAFDIGGSFEPLAAES